MRVRGLKCLRHNEIRTNVRVAPHAGAWIEINRFMSRPSLNRSVAPHAGAWIEIYRYSIPAFGYRPSHPMRVRGLKYLNRRLRGEVAVVAPHAGAWIEIFSRGDQRLYCTGRTPCGCVD